MNPPDPATRVRQLRQDLDRHNQLYYIEASPEISDAEYDALFRELQELEKAHPDLDDPNSPTRRVGGQPLDAFESRQHLVPMLSIDDVFERKPDQIGEGERPEAELIAFYKRLQKNLGHEDVTVTVEPKIDGVAVSLVYRDRALTYAVTRGDGRRGDDITANVRTIRSIPLVLPDMAPPLIEVRGEVFMRGSDFAALNEKMDEAGLPTFVNPRNATAGTLKLLDPATVAQRPLAFLAHGLGAHEGVTFTTEEDFHRLLDELGIPRNQPVLDAAGLDAVLDAVAEINRLRHNLDHGTDGAVVKVTRRDERDQLGFTSRAPRWAAAYKFLPEQKETVLRDILIQVGRTGVLTPVAALDPVFVSGTTVSRATLHNEEEIARKDVRIGDTVLVEKAGEIIPAVVKVITDKRPAAAEPWSLPEAVDHQCPSCHGPISREEGFVAWRCTNFACPAQAVTRIRHFGSRKALDIEGLGAVVAEAVVTRGLATTPLDLFSLTEAELEPLNLGTNEAPRRFGEKNAAKMVAALDHARQAMPLDRWVFAMGIPHIGETASREVSRLHEDWESLFASTLLEMILRLEDLQAEQRDVSPRNRSNPPADEEEKKNRQGRYEALRAEIAELRNQIAPYAVSPDLGPVAARSLTAFFQSEAGRMVRDRLRELGINPPSDNYAPRPGETTNLPLAGKTFVLTGTLSHPRDEVKKRIEDAGGKVAGSVSGNTDYLVAGEGGGSKRDKADKLGVAIIDEGGLDALIAD